MKIAILQSDIAWHDATENRKRFGTMIATNSGANLYVLPEMWPTGFVTEPEGVAEHADESPSLEWMRRTATQTGAAIAGSVATEEKGLFFNRFYFVKPDGSVTHYDKHHLFGYGGEGKNYTAGNRRVVVEWLGVHFLLNVCYDLRFPIWSRNRGDYDAALYVASWPTPRVEAWSALLKARAIENQCYVVGVNRIGSDPNCVYPGASCVIDPWGNIIADCGRDKACAAVCEIDMDALAAFRKQFPVLEDADAFSL